jgi:CRISPR-associated protein Csm4
MEMNLLRFRIEPTSSWRTPWQADTLTGMLASTLARVGGPERLESDLLDPWRRGEPPFVLSDGCPGNLLPSPACLMLWPRPEAERKRVKRTLWLTREQFTDLQQGRMPEIPGELHDPFHSSVRMRNTLDRQSDCTGESGSLYEVATEDLSHPDPDLASIYANSLGATWCRVHKADEPCPYLSIYVKVSPQGSGLLRELLTLLSESGFGADTSAGFGQFRLADESEDASWLAEVAGPDGWVSLSTFQPDAHDPTDGYWRSFVKYGKLGPDFGVDGVFKRPQWMLEAGACFRSRNRQRDWYGRLIPSEELLPESARQALRAEGKAPVQPAFALAVPLRWAKEYNP